MGSRRRASGGGCGLGIPAEKVNTALLQGRGAAVFVQKFWRSKNL
jgi:hypothetical protein